MVEIYHREVVIVIVVLLVKYICFGLVSVFLVRLFTYVVSTEAIKISDMIGNNKL